MRTRVIVLVAVLAGGLGVAAGLLSNGPGPLLRSELGQRVLQGVLSTTAPTPPAGVAVAGRGDPMPALRLAALDGAAVPLPGRYAGRPLLVNFWASWCGPCIQEMPELDRYARSQGDNGTQVVGIALDTPDDVRAFLARIPVAYPVLLDTPGAADSGVRMGNTRGVLPYTVLVGADGRLQRQKVGPFQPGEIEAWARQ